MTNPVSEIIHYLSAVNRVVIRRARHGPYYPGWSLPFEVITEVLRQSQEAAAKHDVETQRKMMNGAVAFSPEQMRMRVHKTILNGVPGHWFIPRAGFRPDRTVLYLHGGGYAFYVRHHANLISAVARAARARLFALDYRLAPEHPYPAQIEDALTAYQGLLANGILPENILLSGDSSGGNLSIVLLLHMREFGLPLPRAVVLICPWVDMADTRPSLGENIDFDWIATHNVYSFVEWYLQGHDPLDPLISPVNADLSGLPPIYVQAGGAEILRDQVVAFVETARQHGVDISLDIFPGMNHIFQAFGDLLPQSRDALRRIRAFVDQIWAAPQ